MKIEVTEEDIRLAHRARSFSCPIARAVSRTLHLPLGHAAMVMTDVVIYNRQAYDVQGDKYLRGFGHTGRKFIPVSSDVSGKAKEFDQTGNMSPFTFDLPL